LCTMRKNLLFILTLLISQLSFGQKIESIIEFIVIEDSLVKNRVTYFNQSGGVVCDSLKWFYDPINNSKTFKIRKVSYQSKNKIHEINYDWYIERDTNVVRSFSTYKLDSITNRETQICYEADSLIRFVRETLLSKNLKRTYTKSWEFNPVAKINNTPELTLTDSIFFDNKNRPIRHLYTNSDLDGNIERNISYKNDSVYIKLNAGSFERKVVMEYSEMQRQIDSLKMDYKFKAQPKFIYKFTYFE